MTANLQNPIFLDDIKAREWLEARVWPNGPVCPHCGATGDDVTALKGKAHRPASISAASAANNSRSRSKPYSSAPKSRCPSGWPLYSC